MSLSSLAQTSGEDTFEMHTGMPTVSETRYNILQGPITDPSTSVPTTYPMDINQCDFEPVSNVCVCSTM